MAVMGKDNKSIVRDFLEKIKKLVTTDVVEEDLVKVVSNREIAKRSSALATLLELIQRQENDIRKIKPDLEQYAEDGTPTGVFYSKGQSEALKRARERLDKMEKAFEKGIKGDLSDVYNLIKDKNEGGKESKGETS